jgi:catechol 2,3-dioxygenase-like lactoylglutathione lyase family enzyme
MFDHVGLPVQGAAKSCAFYVAALPPLGIGRPVRLSGWVGFGEPGRRQLRLGGQGRPLNGTHTAFASMTRAGADGVYHADYFGAFVLDPDGHDIEAVSHRAESA